MSRASSGSRSTSLMLEACGLSHPGRQRTENEDAIGVFLKDRLFVVADGMGGRAAGDVAARIAVANLESFFRSQHANPRNPWPFPLDKNQSLGANLLAVGMKVANQQIRAEAAANPSLHRMGATVAALAIGETQFVAANVGDVRIYRIRDEKIERISRDHSLLEEMRAARPNMTTEEMAAFAHKNVVTRALGTRDEVEATVVNDVMATNDIYLLCSDGLWNTVPDDLILEIVTGTPTLQAGCQTLIDAANEAGSPDNVSALLIRVS